MLTRIFDKARASPGIFLGISALALGALLALLLTAHIVLLAVHIGQHRALETNVINTIRSK